MVNPPIEQIIIEWLAKDDNLTGYTVAAQMPATNPQKAIIVEQTSASITDVTSDWTLSVDVYDVTRYTCAQAMQLVLNRLQDLWKVPQIADYSVNTVAHYPYPGTPVRERYTLTLLVTTATN